MADEVLVKAVPVYPRVCEEGLYSQPKGKFKVAVFNDDAVGTHIGVIFHEPHQKDWYWQEPEWSQDVTAFWWGLGGNYLYVSTSEIYGTGAVYELDLVKKKARSLLPKGYSSTDEYNSSEILRYDAASNSLECRLYSPGGEDAPSKVVKIPLKQQKDNKSEMATPRKPTD